MFMNKELIIKYCDVSTMTPILQELKRCAVDLDMTINRGLDYVLLGSTPSIASDISRFIASKLITTQFVLDHMQNLLHYHSLHK